MLNLCINVFIYFAQIFSKMCIVFINLINPKVVSTTKTINTPWFTQCSTHQLCDLLGVTACFYTLSTEPIKITTLNNLGDVL